MVDTSQLYALVGRIVEEHLPDEAPIFELEGGGMLAEAMAGGSPRQVTVAAEMGLVEPGAAHTTVELIGLITATIGLVNHLLALRAETKKVAATDDVARKWVGELERNGIPAPKAERIAEQFTEELSDLY